MVHGSAHAFKTTEDLFTYGHIVKKNLHDPNYEWIIDDEIFLTESCIRV